MKTARTLLMNTVVIGEMIAQAVRLQAAALHKAREYVPRHSLRTCLAVTPGFMSAWHLS